LALVGQSGNGQRGDLFGQARLLRHSQFIDRRITVDAPSMSAAALAQQPARPSTPLTQLCFFQSISIDARRRRDNEKKMASTKKTDNELAPREPVVVRLTEQFTHRFFITSPASERRRC